MVYLNSCLSHQRRKQLFIPLCDAQKRVTWKNNKKYVFCLQLLRLYKWYSMWPVPNCMNIFRSENIRNLCDSIVRKNLTWVMVYSNSSLFPLWLRKRVLRNRWGHKQLFIPWWDKQQFKKVGYFKYSVYVLPKSLRKTDWV